MKVKLELGQRRWHKLHEMADGRGKQMTIEKKLLRLLLIDHSRLYAAVVRNDVEIEEPGP